MTPAAIVATAHAGNVVTAFLANGKYVFAEAISEGFFRQRDTDTKLVRFTATGGVDPTFNSRTFDFVGEGGFAQGDATTALAMQPNGQIVLASAHTSGGFSEFALARVNSDGSRDLNFGSSGVATTNVAGVEILKDLLVQADGKILAIGTANGFSQIVLARYLAQ